MTRIISFLFLVVAFVSQLALLMATAAAIVQVTDAAVTKPNDTDVAAALSDVKWYIQRIKIGWERAALRNPLLEGFMDTETSRELELDAQSFSAAKRAVSHALLVDETAAAAIVNKVTLRELNAAKP